MRQTYMEYSVPLYWFVSLEAKAGSIQLLNMSKPTDTDPHPHTSPPPDPPLKAPPPPLPALLAPPTEENNGVLLKAFPLRSSPFQTTGFWIHGKSNWVCPKTSPFSLLTNTVLNKPHPLPPPIYWQTSALKKNSHIQETCCTPTVHEWNAYEWCRKDKQSK